MVSAAESDRKATRVREPGRFPVKFAFSSGVSGAHASRTLMVPGLTTLLGAVPKDAVRDRYVQLIVDENALGKRTASNRNLSAKYLVDLYALDPNIATFRLLRFFWKMHQPGRPVLALICGYVRDPLLRASDRIVSVTKLDESVTSDNFVDFFNREPPARFSEASLGSLGQNFVASWAQAGFFTGKIKKVRTRPVVPCRGGLRPRARLPLRPPGTAPAGKRVGSTLGCAPRSGDATRPGGIKARLARFQRRRQSLHHRPFISHIWDGHKDDFSALANYHKLGHKLREKLTYTYLGDWIKSRRQWRMKNPVPRTACSEKLELILEGEALYEIFVRWNPDFNDGVRLNIRHFMTADVLRKRPNIKWGVDRGKNSPGSPWGEVRDNDRHLTLAEKRERRQNLGTES